MLHKNVYLQSLAYELPSQVVTTNSICERLTPTFQRLGIPSSWVCALSGVNERRVWGEGESLADIAARIARKVVEDSGISLERIGCVVCTSVSKEFIEPSMACMVHSALGLPETTSSYDISNACLAFLNGISQMGQLIDQGAIEAALIVDVENSRQVIENTVRQLEDPRIDLATFSKCFAGLTLGSGAVAALITNRQLAPQGHKVVGHVSLADTRFCRYCVGTISDIATNQTGLLKAGIDLASRTWKMAEKTLAWSPERIKRFICHQVGDRHQRLLFERLGIGLEKAFLTFPFLGNIGPASAPITLAIASERGEITSGDRVGLMGIGSGINCSMMEIAW